MGFMKYCRICQDYYPADVYPRHMAQHSIGDGSVEHKQYTGSVKKEENYMVCVLHQKKCPCNSRKFDGSKCDYPFGMINKKFMMNCIRGLPINKELFKDDPTFRYPPFFPVSNDANGWDMIPIDMETRTVTIKGVPIKLKF